jgi:hypothetical protein
MSDELEALHPAYFANFPLAGWKVSKKEPELLVVSEYEEGDTRREIVLMPDGSFERHVTTHGCKVRVGHMNVVNATIKSKEKL